MSQTFHIELFESEVVLLDSILTRLAKRSDFKALLPDRADQQVVHNLIAVLEHIDPALFAEDYDGWLAAARDRVLSDH